MLNFQALFRAILVFLVCIAAGFPAWADSPRVFGVDSRGDFSWLPTTLCVRPGQTIRIRADRVNPSCLRQGIAPESFVWSLSRTRGPWVTWNPNSHEQNPFFRRSQTIPGAVEFRVPQEIRTDAVLRVSDRETQYGARIWLKDYNLDPNHCVWGENDIYMGEGPPPWIQPGHVLLAPLSCPSL